MADYLAFLVVLSNLFYLFPVVVLLALEQQRYAWEACDFLIVCLVSSVYHSCAAPQLQWCPVSYNGLEFVDAFLAIWTMTAIVSPFLHHVDELYRVVFRLTMALLAFMCALVIAQPGYSALLILGIEVGAFAFVLWRTRTYAHGRHWWPFFIAASAFSVAGIACFAVDSRYDVASGTYEQLHSVWHIFSALAAGLFYLALPHVDFYKNETQAKALITPATVAFSAPSSSSSGKPAYAPVPRSEAPAAAVMDATSGLSL